jgi:hypothetical protein
MYKVVETNLEQKVIGVIDLDDIEKNGSLETYWNTKIQTPSKRLMTFDWSEAKRVYDELDLKYPSRFFEIRNYP